MKKRIVSLALAVLLLIGVLALPASAASRTDVYNYFKSLVVFDSNYNSDGNFYADGFSLDESSNTYYAVYYWVETKEIELTIFNETIEVTLVLSSSMSLPYTAYVRKYVGTNFPTGQVKVNANYNGSAFSGFSSYTGDNSYKSEMLETLNSILPWVLEYSRALLWQNGYTLKDMGLTGYTACNIHCWDNGTVTKQPTCVSAGTMTYTCVNCGATVVESIDPTGVHTWDKGTVIQEPGCTTEGTMRYTCTVCKTTHDEPIAALGHAWKFTRLISWPETGFHGGQALYTCSRCGQTKNGELCAKEVFTDMPKKSHWAHNAIDWAFFMGITGGTSDTTFSPNKIVTRGEVVTFLYTMKGKPEVSGTNPFKDVKKKDFYYNAVLWAVQNGITGGTTDTTFSPKKTCTRAEIVMFLWGAAGRPEPTSTTNPFKDVKQKDYYYKAVLWAVENGITRGVDDTHFGPKVDCTRAQVMTFLYAASPILMS